MFEQETTTEVTEDTEGMERDPLTGRVIGCAIEVHRTLGPGLLESTYEQCLARELDPQGIAFQIQLPNTCSVQRHSSGLRLPH